LRRAIPLKEKAREDPQASIGGFVLSAVFSPLNTGSKSRCQISAKRTPPRPLSARCNKRSAFPPCFFHWDKWDNWDKSPKALPIGNLVFPSCIFIVGQHWDTVGQLSCRTYQDGKAGGNEQRRACPGACSVFIASGGQEAPATCPTRCAGRGHQAAAGSLHSGATVRGRADNFCWQLFPPWLLPYIARSVLACRILSSSACCHHRAPAAGCYRSRRPPPSAEVPA